jgi:hypothetical protein
VEDRQQDQGQDYRHENRAQTPEAVRRKQEHGRPLLLSVVGDPGQVATLGATAEERGKPGAGNGVRAVGVDPLGRSPRRAKMPGR